MQIKLRVGTRIRSFDSNGVDTTWQVSHKDRGLARAPRAKPLSLCCESENFAKLCVEVWRCSIAAASSLSLSAAPNLLFLWFPRQGIRPGHFPGDDIAGNDIEAIAPA